MLKNFHKLFICLIISGFSLLFADPPLYGLVIEGQDCTGKTTVINLLAEILEEEDIFFKKGHGQLTDSPLVTLLCKQAFGSLPDFSKKREDIFLSLEGFNKFRLAQLSLDALEYKAHFHQNRTTFLLQDRYFFSQILFNTVFDTGTDKEIETFNSYYRPFLLNV